MIKELSQKIIITKKKQQQHNIRKHKVTNDLKISFRANYEQFLGWESFECFYKLYTQNIIELS